MTTPSITALLFFWLATPNGAPPPHPSLHHAPGGKKIGGTAAQGRHIVFTFDDGPSYQTTPLLLDYLDTFNIKAVFYVNGRRFGGRSPISRRNRAILAETHRRGHYVGNHTWSHPNMAQINGTRQSKEILRNETLIQRVTGYRTQLYRPPFGLMTRFSKALLEGRGYTVVMWNLDSNDPFERSAQKSYTNVLKAIFQHKRGVVLMHDTHSWSVEAVPRIIKAVYLWNCELSARGEPVFEFGTTRDFYIKRNGETPEPTLAMLRAAQRRRTAMANWCKALTKGK